MKKWEKLPESFRNDAVKEYYDILASRPVNFFAKRMFDILVGIIVLAITWPFMLIIAVWIKLDSKGPVIFRQRRLGLHGKEFDIYKSQRILYLQLFDKYSCRERKSCI